MTMKTYIVLIALIYLSSPANGATGPTAYGSIQIPSNIISPANQYSSIPVSLKMVLPNGTQDYSFTQSVTLGGATGSESLYLDGKFHTKWF